VHENGPAGNSSRELARFSPLVYVYKHRYTCWKIYIRCNSKSKILFMIINVHWSFGEFCKIYRETICSDRVGPYTYSASIKVRHGPRQNMVRGEPYIMKMPIIQYLLQLHKTHSTLSAINKVLVPLRYSFKMKVFDSDWILLQG